MAPLLHTQRGRPAPSTPGVQAAAPLPQSAESVSTASVSLPSRHADLLQLPDALAIKSFDREILQAITNRPEDIALFAIPGTYSILIGLPVPSPAVSLGLEATARFTPLPPLFPPLPDLNYGDSSDTLLQSLMSRAHAQSIIYDIKPLVPLKHTMNQKLVEHEDADVNEALTRVEKAKFCRKHLIAQNNYQTAAVKAEKFDTIQHAAQDERQRTRVRSYACSIADRLSKLESDMKHQADDEGPDGFED